MKKNRVSLYLLGAVLLLASCENKSNFDYFYYTPEDQAILSQYLNLPDIPDDYSVSFPTHLSRSGLFARKVERDKAVLGRVLFYDKSLSKDGTISCASCHKQEVGFGDNTAVSKGVYDRAGDRNSISLASVANFSAYYGTDLNGPSAIRFFWDNRAETAMDQSTGSLTNPKEMDMTMHEVSGAVASRPYYGPLFTKAFGDATVSESRVLEAIANFVNAMGSYNSKFDDAASQASGTSYTSNYNTDFPTFTEAENSGKATFMQYCSSCHSSNMGRPVLFNANNGLDAQTIDPGVGGISSKSAELGTFKVPTLRNIALTAPYMHDGRFATLDQVIDHYSNNIQSHPNLHPNLKAPSGEPIRPNFNAQTKADLIAFLNTLTDNRFLTDPKFSNPFKQ